MPLRPHPSRAAPRPPQDDGQQASDPLLATRILRASFASRDVKQRQVRSPDRAERNPADDRDALAPLPDFTSFHPGYAGKKRKRNAGRRSVSCPARKRRAVRATERRLAPPSACGRARLPAFHHGSRQRDYSSLRLSFGPGFPGRGAKRCGRARQRRSQFQRSTSRAGPSAGRHDARAARERIVTPPAGTALAPHPGVPSAEGVLH